jgi:hypothetical protein
MDRGHDREPIFADDEDPHAFSGLLGRYQSQFRVRLYHDCLMTNHFHVLVQLENPAQVSALTAGAGPRPGGAVAHPMPRRRRADFLPTTLVSKD